MCDTVYLVTVENTEMSNNESSSYFEDKWGRGEEVIVSKDEENVHDFV